MWNKRMQKSGGDNLVKKPMKENNVKNTEERTGIKHR